jgi:hypothetical protein
MLLDQRTTIIVYVPKGNSTNVVSTLITYEMCASNFIEINLTCLNEN